MKNIIQKIKKKLKILKYGGVDYYIRHTIRELIKNKDTSGLINFIRENRKIIDYNSINYLESGEIKTLIKLIADAGLGITLEFRSILLSTGIRQYFDTYGYCFFPPDLILNHLSYSDDDDDREELFNADSLLTYYSLDEEMIDKVYRLYLIHNRGSIKWFWWLIANHQNLSVEFINKHRKQLMYFYYVIYNRYAEGELKQLDDNFIKDKKNVNYYIESTLKNHIRNS